MFSPQEESDGEVESNPNIVNLKCGLPRPREQIYHEAIFEEESRDNLSQSENSWQYRAIKRPTKQSKVTL